MQNFFKKRIKKVLEQATRKELDLHKALEDEKNICLKTCDFDEKIWQIEANKQLRFYVNKLKEKQSQQMSQIKMPLY